jgi:para-aminobenzoate synthetase component 1
MTNWSPNKTLFVFDWKGPDAFQSFAPLAAMPYSLFFDSNRDGHPGNNYSYICWHPFETIESKNTRIRITNRENQTSYIADAFDVVKERLELWGEKFQSQENLPPFQGGAAGYFGYDLARGLENLPKIAEDDRDMPDMCIGLYDKVLAFDHNSGQAWLMIYAVDEQTALVHKTHIERLMSRAHEPVFYPVNLPWSAQVCEADYLNDIDKVINYIHAGDIFQANLSRRFTAALPHHFDAFAHYGQLRKINAAPYSAFMNFGGITLASSSPEKFLSVHDRQVETKPIKGTMPSSKPEQALLDSEKDRAENAMIVDLLRNDLSKVCEDHSIDETELFKVETFEGVHHLVSTIRGKLRADQTSLDLLKACFPGGSITGAPKVRAMEIIEEMEPQRRGPYCGAIGFIGFDGTMETNIAIRTLVFSGGQVQLQTGGGITAGSNAQAELEETLTKATKLFESFETQRDISKTA